MDFRFTAEEDAFRREVAEWLEANLPPGDSARSMGEEDDEFFAFEAEMRKKLAAQGWLTTWWPVEYGGKGWSIWQQVVFNEEMAAHGVVGIGGHAVNTAGPSIIAHGTEEQKRKHLPAICRGEGIYWLGFTEPNAGSDLASLQMRADRDGDDYILNGSKLYIGDNREGDYLYAAVRTDPDLPKHQGISIFLVDLHSAGVSRQKLRRFGGGVKNQIFFDNVRAPATDMVGELNRGWSIVHTTLNLDRAGHGGHERALREWVDFARWTQETSHNGCRLWDEEATQQRLVKSYMEIQHLRLLYWRVVSMRSKERPISYESSIFALYRKMMGVRWSEAQNEIAGLYGQLKKGSKWAPLDGRVEHAQRERLFTHGGGTPEIQKNIIATRGLGLPRG